MPLDHLTPHERHIIGQCLRAAVDSPFLINENAADDPYWEIHSLFGLTYDELADVARAWPDIDDTNPDVRLAIHGSLLNLLGYPHGRMHEWSAYISAPPDEVERIFRKWRDLHAPEGKTVRRHPDG